PVSCGAPIGSRISITAIVTDCMQPHQPVLCKKPGGGPMQRLLAALIVALLSLPLAHAQSYPSKPIRFVISFGPGSASDVLARIAGQELYQSLGQPIVVLPKP